MGDYSTWSAGTGKQSSINLWVITNNYFIITAVLYHSTTTTTTATTFFFSIFKNIFCRLFLQVNSFHHYSFLVDFYQVKHPSYKSQWIELLASKQSGNNTLYKCKISIESDLRIQHRCGASVVFKKNLILIKSMKSINKSFHRKKVSVHLCGGKKTTFKI